MAVAVSIGAVELWPEMVKAGSAAMLGMHVPLQEVMSTGEE